MYFRHISDKIQPKYLKQHFDWGAGPPGYGLVIFSYINTNTTTTWTSFILFSTFRLLLVAIAGLEYFVPTECV